MGAQVLDHPVYERMIAGIGLQFNYIIFSVLTIASGRYKINVSNLIPFIFYEIIYFYIKNRN